MDSSVAGATEGAVVPAGVVEPARLEHSSDKHPRQALDAINVLRLHRELCDVVLVVGSKKIFAHRIVLSACSPYFHAMFTGELAESRQTEVSSRPFALLMKVFPRPFLYSIVFIFSLDKYVYWYRFNYSRTIRYVYKWLKGLAPIV